MTYKILGFQTTETKNGCDAEREANTIKEALSEARYMLSDDYRKASEAAERLAKVQVWRGNELVVEIE